MDKEFTTIVEFIEFCYKITKSDKGVKNFQRLVVGNVLPTHVTEIKAAFSTYFSSITQWSNFSGQIIFKKGMLNMSAIEKKCAKNPEDLDEFGQFMATFRALYADVRRNLDEFIAKLNLEQGSPEAKFMTRLFSDIGGEIMDTIKSGGDTKDLASLFPKALEMLKSGKLMETMEKLKDGTIKISKILRAFVVLVEEYEKESEMKLIGQGEEIGTSIALAVDDEDENETSENEKD